mmetsp:Transcript_8977/g.21349  ORF Transcript_8977/g.21349 Transcript_8977/m.21349 type:complete len:211 (-) Transcript_8977:206-838(-)
MQRARHDATASAKTIPQLVALLLAMLSDGGHLPPGQQAGVHRSGRLPTGRTAATGGISPHALRPIPGTQIHLWPPGVSHAAARSTIPLRPPPLGRRCGVSGNRRHAGPPSTSTGPRRARCASSFVDVNRRRPGSTRRGPPNHGLCTGGHDNVTLLSHRRSWLNLHRLLQVLEELLLILHDSPLLMDCAFLRLDQLAEITDYSVLLCQLLL